MSASVEPWRFKKGEFACKFLMPNAGRILEKQLEDVLPNQAALQKMQKHAKDDPALFLKMAVSAAADVEFAFVAAAITEPDLSVAQVRALPGDVWESLSVAIHKKLGTGLFRFELSGPGERDDEDAGDAGEPVGKDDLARVLGDSAR